MRRWLAISMAAIIAVTGSVLSFGGDSPTAHAGIPPNVTWSIDCDTGTAGIQANCVFGSGATVPIAVYVSATTGFNTAGVNTDVDSSPSAGFTQSPAPAPAGAFVDPDWACSPPPPADGFISCFTGSDFKAIPGGNSPQIVFTMSWNATIDGVYDLSLTDTSIADDGFADVGSCNPLTSVAATCNGATIQIGASAATATPTNTPVPATATSTPCPVGAPGCATATSQAFVTVTPTGSPTAPPTNTPAPGTTTTAPTTAPGQPTAPGGTTGGGGSGPGITLPDTGSNGDGGNSTWLIGLAGVAALGAAGLAGGLWFNAAANRRRGED